jgi:hypothetical protein
MRFVDANDTELMWRSHSKFVTVGRNFLVGDVEPTLLLLRAGESAVRNSEGADGLAVTALQNLAVTREWLAIEGKDLVRRISGYVFGNHDPEVRVAKGKSKIRAVIVVFFYGEGCAGIRGQADLCRSGVFIGMKLHFETGILRDCGYAAQEYEGGERNKYGESVDTVKSHARETPFLHPKYAREQSGVPRHQKNHFKCAKAKGPLVLSNPFACNGRGN